MRNEDRGGAPAKIASSEAHAGERGLAVHRRPGVLAAGAALLTLGIGVILGRATARGSSEEQPAVQIERPLAAASPPVQAPVAEPERHPTDVYRVQFGRSMPKARVAEGFVRDAADKPPTGSIAAEGSLHFSLAARPSEYALTTILRVKGGKTATLHASLDGTPLGDWALDDQWEMYTSAVSRELLKETDHELVLSSSGLPKSALVNIAALAVVPVGDELQLDIGPDAIGHLIHGFSGLEGGTVWSDGPRSAIGAVLAAKPVPYELTVRGATLPQLAPLAVECRVNGIDVGSGSFTSKVGEATWAVPSKIVRSGLNRIDFSYPATGQPAEYDRASKDKRELGLRFYNVVLSPHS